MKNIHCLRLLLFFADEEGPVKKKPTSTWVPLSPKFYIGSNPKVPVEQIMQLKPLYKYHKSEDFVSIAKMAMDIYSEERKKNNTQPYALLRIIGKLCIACGTQYLNEEMKYQGLNEARDPIFGEIGDIKKQNIDGMLLDDGCDFFMEKHVPFLFKNDEERKKKFLEGKFSRSIPNPKVETNKKYFEGALKNPISKKLMQMMINLEIIERPHIWKDLGEQ